MVERSTERAIDTDRADVSVRPLTERDVVDADRIFRLAFGTWLKLPDPMQFGGDASWIATRLAGHLGGAHAADGGGRLVGSNFTADRGSVGFFGPLTVDPEWWGRGVAQALVSAAIDDFTRWGTRYAGLYTFADSVLHVALYRKFGFWPGYLTGIFSTQLTGEPRGAALIRYSSAGADERRALERRADEICNVAREGLTVTPEIRSVADQQLGDTVFVAGANGLDAFAVCHCGPGTEAGSGVCRVKFAAAASASAFDAAIDAWEALALARGTLQVQAGMNFGRELATRALLRRGYKTIRQGVAMYGRNEPAYDRADAFIVDDWR